MKEQVLRCLTIKGTIEKERLLKFFYMTDLEDVADWWPTPLVITCHQSAWNTLCVQGRAYLKKTSGILATVSVWDTCLSCGEAVSPAQNRNW